jgi:hypothetical protein
MEVWLRHKYISHLGDDRWAPGTARSAFFCSSQYRPEPGRGPGCSRIKPRHAGKQRADRDSMADVSRARVEAMLRAGC